MITAAMVPCSARRNKQPKYDHRIQYYPLHFHAMYIAENVPVRGNNTLKNLYRKKPESKAYRMLLHPRSCTEHIGKLVSTVQTDGVR